LRFASKSDAGHGAFQALKNRGALVQKRQRPRHRLLERKRGSLSEGFNEGRSWFALARRVKLDLRSFAASTTDYEIAASRPQPWHGPTPSQRHAKTRRGHGHPAVQGLLMSSPEPGCHASNRPNPRRMDSKILKRSTSPMSTTRRSMPTTRSNCRLQMEPREAKCASPPLRLRVFPPARARALTRSSAPPTTHAPAIASARQRTSGSHSHLEPVFLP
jgi:hypothetical protein